MTVDEMSTLLVFHKGIQGILRENLAFYWKSVKVLSPGTTFNLDNCIGL